MPEQTEPADVNETALNEFVGLMVGPPRNYDEGRGLLSEDEQTMEYSYWLNTQDLNRR